MNPTPDKTGPGIEAVLAPLLATLGRRSLVVGILNVTPDSFSDGGRYDALGPALAHGGAMVLAGASIIDIGGESTRPGFTPVPAEIEWQRIGRILAALAAQLPVPLSVDTTKSEVARRAIRAGAAMVNDIWGLQGDPAMAAVVADAGVAVVVMHNRAEIDASIDIVADMRRYFDRTLAIAAEAGIRQDRIILDPGIGFGKTPAQQVAAIAGVAALRRYGLPVLIGVSRKSFLGRLTGAPAGERLIGTVAANLAAAQAGATLFRVHDVAEHVAALRVFDAIREVASS